ncbi:MAG: hypothetical protein SF069_10560 [Phycisphaerae bacterium]|nr:hypothetical protein [Phycisphaerae bacterium]
MSNVARDNGSLSTVTLGQPLKFEQVSPAQGFTLGSLTSLDGSTFVALDALAIQQPRQRPSRTRRLIECRDSAGVVGQVTGRAIQRRHERSQLIAIDTAPGVHPA